VHLFGDEKMTKPATACEEFDEAFWNDDVAPVIRDERSDKLSESRHSFSLAETCVAEGRHGEYRADVENARSALRQMRAAFQPNTTGKGRTPKVYSAQSNANSPPAHRRFYYHTT
jgi:hypothetical protein